MVTFKQLEDYLTENECDIFQDSPCVDYIESEWNIFRDMWIKNIHTKYNVVISDDEDWYDNIWDFVYKNHIDVDDMNNLGLETMVNWINENNIEVDVEYRRYG